MHSIEYQIEKRIKSRPRGTVFFPDDFSAMGTSEAIRQGLVRLEKKKIIVRIAHGIYVRPKEHHLLGKVLPTAEEVAAAIVKRDRIRTVPAGAFALHSLGLTTQVPMKIVLLTDGSSRIIKVGRRTIKFKKTTPRNLLVKGEISKLVIQALKEIGNGKQTTEEEKKLIELLKKESVTTLKHDMVHAPIWIRKIMKKALT